MLEFQFIKNTLGLQEKDHIICENDGKILKLVFSFTALTPNVSISIFNFPCNVFFLDFYRILYCHFYNCLF